ncbi:SRPBCC family protein [Ignavibacterium sp.]|uniref:SRPBCC family protein n=1 Tax=Ignavibacterium sp. TaxID=2651167 RepID=UPI00307F323A
MPKIIASDSTYLNHSIVKVWEVISDFNSYKKWWPAVVNLEVLNTSPQIIGSTLVAKPFNGRSFSIKAVEAKPFSEIKLKYFAGIYSGDGRWIFESVNDKTKLTYEVNLIITDKFTKVIAWIVPVSKIHSLIFKKIFRSLEKYLEELK